MGEEVNDDCLSCRIISGSTMFGISIYLGYHARKLEGFNKIGLMAIAIGVAGLGTTRLLQIYPFTKKDSSA